METTIDRNFNYSKSVFKFFCSIKLTIATLVSLAVTSVIGTILPQNASPQIYIEKYGDTFYTIFKIFDFNDMYHAWWYVSLIIILCVNIIACSINRLDQTFKIIFPKKITFNPSRFKRQKNIQIFKINKNIETLADHYQSFILKQYGEPIVQKSESGLMIYAEKGRWTRIGAYVVHLSIILLLIGGLIGSILGFKAQVRIEEGNAAKTVINVKTLQPFNLPFSIKCNSFNVRFYDSGMPDEFRSNLTIIENGKESITKDILVNHPLRYKGINIFQSSYGLTEPDTAIFEVFHPQSNGRLTQKLKKGEKISIENGKVIFSFDRFLPQYNFKGQDLGAIVVGSVIHEGKESEVIPLPIKFPSFDKMRKGQYVFSVTGVNEKYYTGLEITKDPGIWLVYTGFIFMILGCWITFLMSHQSVFIEIIRNGPDSSEIRVSGKANRSHQNMKIKIGKLTNELKNL